jgi:hypothetical protein
MKKSKLLYTLVLLLTALTTVRGQQEKDYSVHANIIYRFTKYIDWPDSKKSGDFIIGVVGDSPLFDALKNYISTKTVGNQKILVKRISERESSYNYQIIFICEEESHSLKKIVNLTAGTPTLILSESEGLARTGSCINFITVNDRLRLEINKGNIEQRKLSIASELLALGTIIK